MFRFALPGAPRARWLVFAATLGIVAAAVPALDWRILSDEKIAAIPLLTRLRIDQRSA